MKLRKICLIMMLSMMWVGSFAADAILSGRPLTEPQFLPVDEAFMLTVNRQGNQLQLHWLVQPGYYLYRDKLSFSGINHKVQAELPSGVQKFDEIFGEVEVYYEELAISLQIFGDFGEDTHKIVIGYQGCADAGLCYPPQKRDFLVKDL